MMKVKVSSKRDAGAGSVVSMSEMQTEQRRKDLADAGGSGHLARTDEAGRWEMEEEEAVERRTLA